MARPPKPAPVWSDIDLDHWEQEPDWMASCRATGQSPGYQIMHTVLVNERPSRQGERDASFCLGYEDCLAKLEFLAKGHSRPRADQQGEPDYVNPAALAELGWQTPKN